MIETTIPSIVQYQGVVPNEDITDDNEYALAVFDFIRFHGQTLTSDINGNFLPALSALSGEMNTIADEMNSSKQDVLEIQENISGFIDTSMDKAQEASDSAEASLQSRDEAIQAKVDVVLAIEEAEVYNPTSLERRVKADLFGMSLL